MNQQRVSLSTAVVKEGRLLKCGRKLTSGWKPRHVILRADSLSYSPIRGQGQLLLQQAHQTQQQQAQQLMMDNKRRVEMREDTVIRQRTELRALAFEVFTPGFRPITLLAESKEELDSWLEALSKVKRNAPPHPLRVMIVGDDDEPTHGKARWVTKLLETLAGMEIAKKVIPMKYFLPTPPSEKGLAARIGVIIGSRPSSASLPPIDTNEVTILGGHGPVESTRSTVASNGRRTIDILVPLEEGGKTSVKVVLWCAPSGDAFAKERAISFASADIIIFMFSVSESTSFENIENRWLPEARRCTIEAKKSATGGTGPPFYLIGTRKMNEMVTVSHSSAQEICKRYNMESYQECRLEEGESVQSTTENVVRAVVAARKLEGLPILDGGVEPPPTAKHSRGPSFNFIAKVGGVLSRPFTKRGSKTGTIPLIPVISTATAEATSEASTATTDNLVGSPPLDTEAENNIAAFLSSRMDEPPKIEVSTLPPARSHRRAQSLDFAEESHEASPDTNGINIIINNTGEENLTRFMAGSVGSITSKKKSSTSSAGASSVSASSNSGAASKNRPASVDDDDADSDNGSVVGPDSDEDVDESNSLLNEIDFSNAWTDDFSYARRVNSLNGNRTSLTQALKSILASGAPNDGGGPSEEGGIGIRRMPNGVLHAMKSQRGILFAIDEKPSEEQKELTELKEREALKELEITSMRNRLEMMNHEQSSFKRKLRSAHEELTQVRKKFE